MTTSSALRRRFAYRFLAALFSMRISDRARAMSDTAAKFVLCAGDQGFKISLADHNLSKRLSCLVIPKRTYHVIEWKHPINDRLQLIHSNRPIHRVEVR